jgi:hypothetical protein
MRTHEPRYGVHSYAVTVSRQVNEEGTMSVDTDSVTVSGEALMFAAETHQMEDFKDDGAAGGSGMEMPVVAVIAPGQWYAVTMVDVHQAPIFVGRRRGWLDERERLLSRLWLNAACGQRRGWPISLRCLPRHL